VCACVCLDKFLWIDEVATLPVTPGGLRLLLQMWCIESTHVSGVEMIGLHFHRSVCVCVCVCLCVCVCVCVCAHATEGHPCIYVSTLR